MNTDGSYTLPEAARTVARLKTMLLSPYRILAYLEDGGVNLGRKQT